MPKSTSYRNLNAKYLYLLLKFLFVCNTLVQIPHSVGGANSNSRSLENTKKIKKFKATLKKQPNNLKVRVKLAQLLSEQKNSASVIDTLAPFASELDETGLLLLARAYREKHRYQKEAQILEQLVNQKPKSYEAYFILSQSLLNADKVNPAVAALRKVIQLKPDFKPAYDSLLSIFLETNERYESRIIIKDMIRRFGRTAKLYKTQCQLYAIDGFIDETIDHCKKAILLAPHHPDSQVYLAKAYHDKGDEKKFTTTLLLAAKRFPKSDLAQVSAGNYYLERNNYQASIRYFKMAVKFNKNSAEAHLGLAKSLFERKSYREAKDHFLRACQLDHKNSFELRSAISRLRKDSQVRWESQYTSALYRCRQ